MSDGVSRLSRVLGMLGSDHDGEVLNAARHAERIRKEMNKSWSVLLGGSGGGFDDMLRAMRAETRALAAERRATDLELRIVRLEDEIKGLRAAHGTSSSPRSSRSSRSSRAMPTGLSEQQERHLVEGLLDRMRPAEWVHQMTGWPRPMHLLTRLPYLAAKHGLHFEQPMRGYYRFRREP